MKALHAGSLTSLVRQRLGPVLQQTSGIALASESGHSVALATAIKEGRTVGDVYLSADAELSLPYLLLPTEINLSNPAMASTYARVHYTTDRGQTFHGKPISFSAAVLKNAQNPDAALDVVAYLLSPAGQQLVQAAHFLPAQALVGGDAASVPGQLQPLIQGEYQQYAG